MSDTSLQAAADRKTVPSAIRRCTEYDEKQKPPLIDRALLPWFRRQPSGISFTKAKVLYTQKKYAAAAALFHQLAVSAIRSTPGNTTKDEARYFEALSLSKASNATAAKLIWRKLASDSISYYGARSAERLGQRSGLSQNGACDSAGDQVLADALADLTAARRPLRKTEVATDVVSEPSSCNSGTKHPYGWTGRGRGPIAGSPRNWRMRPAGITDRSRMRTACRTGTSRRSLWHILQAFTSRSAPWRKSTIPTRCGCTRSSGRRASTIHLQGPARRPAV